MNNENSIKLLEDKSVRTIWNDKSKKAVIQGGTIAKMAKEQIEEASGRKIVSNKNAKELLNIF